ncbi:MAG: hypothetical protein KF893_22840 [Caldilineaceae bacterium]|nr:hypothetical protein [Caldilineaceae bacterium]
MPAAHPLPRKHASAIRDSLDDLKCLAQRIGLLLTQLEDTERPSSRSLKSTLQEIQSDCYAVALRLSEIELAQNCDSCPCAPARTSTEIYLALLSQKLRQMAEEMWQTAQTGPLLSIHDHDLHN